MTVASLCKLRVSVLLMSVPLGVQDVHVGYECVAVQAVVGSTADAVGALLLRG